jgi:predicted  nucleic acid-binding Zn-ribbon protein
LTAETPSKPAPSAVADLGELATLRAEVARLRDLVGPDEVAYVKLKTELWSARDAAMGAELAAGTLRGRVQALESQLVRVTRQTRYFKRLAISPLRKAKDIVRNL